MHNICLFVPRRVCGILCRVIKKYISGGPDSEGGDPKSGVAAIVHVASLWCPCGVRVVSMWCPVPPPPPPPSEGETDESGSVKQRHKVSRVDWRSLCSGDAVTLMSLAYWLSTHRLRGGLFIDPSLLSSPLLSDIAPLFLSPPSLPLMGCSFWSRAAIISFASLWRKSHRDK